MNKTPLIFMVLILFNKSISFYRNLNKKHLIKSFALKNMSSFVDPIISSNDAVELAKLSAKVRFLDGSWHLDKSRDGKAEFLIDRWTPC